MTIEYDPSIINKTEDYFGITEAAEIVPIVTEKSTRYLDDDRDLSKNSKQCGTTNEHNSK